VTAKLRRVGYRIQEVPISYRPRTLQQGKKIRSRDGFHALWTLIKYRFAPMETFDRRSSRPHSVMVRFALQWLVRGANRM
jgi:hypothetical protein